ncbi:MAG: hypothetical protein WA005_10025 [Candidatus Binataceae bacterium]
MPWITPDVVQFFYQPFPLALVHAFTLGWITATIMSVMCPPERWHSSDGVSLLLRAG